MLVIKIHNDGTGQDGLGNYNCEVLVTTSPTTLKRIAFARVENHWRHNGWRALVRLMVTEAQNEERMVE